VQAQRTDERLRAGMNPHILLAVVSLSTAELPPASATAPQPPGAQEAAPSPGPAPEEAQPPKPSEPVKPESVRQQALKRSKVARYPRLDQPRVLVPALAGAGLGLASGFFYFKATDFHGQLEDGIPTNRSELQATLDSGRRAQRTALILGGASVLAFGTAAFFYFRPLPSTDATVTLLPGPGGAAAVFSGRLP